MGGISYEKWEALQDSDEEGSGPSGRPRAALVRKQASQLSPAGEQAAKAEVSRLAAEEEKKLLQRMERLEQQLEAAAAGLSASASAAASGDSLPPSPNSAAQRRRGLDRIWGAEAERQFEARTGEGSSVPDGGRGASVVAALRGAATEGVDGMRSPPRHWQQSMRRF